MILIVRFRLRGAAAWPGGMKRDSGMPAATCFAGAVCLLSGLPARFVCGGLYR